MRDPAIVVQSRVLSAIILRDVKTRFGGNPVNYVVALAWPLTHIFILLAVYTAAGRAAPYGSDPIQFFAAGVMPVIMFNYPARFVMMSVVTNTPLLGFPVVTLFDLIFARLILEVISATAVVVVASCVLFAIGVDIVPKDPASAIQALLSILMLSTGVGMFNALLAKRIPGWPIVFILITIVMYMASGVVLVPDGLPEKYLYMLSWNPMLHGVSWFRSTFYEGYGSLHLSKQYLVVFALCAFASGLVAERLLRRWLLAS